MAILTSCSKYFWPGLYVIHNEIACIRRGIHEGGNRIRCATNPEEAFQSEIGRIKAEVINSQRHIRYAISNAMKAMSIIITKDSKPDIDD